MRAFPIAAAVSLFFSSAAWGGTSTTPGGTTPKPGRQQRWKSRTSGFGAGHWTALRIHPRTGELVTRGNSGTTEADTYHASVDHPFLEGFRVAKSWKGALRNARSVSLLVADRDHHVIAEVQTQLGAGRRGRVRLATNEATTEHASTQKALEHFFESKPGYQQALAEAAQDSARVEQLGSNYGQLRGMLRPAAPGSTKLAFQRDTAGGVPVLKLKPGARSIELAPGEVLGLEGDIQTSGPPRRFEPQLQVHGRSAPSISSRVPAMTLVSVPHQAAKGTKFTVNYLEGGRPHSLDVIAK